MVLKTDKVGNARRKGKLRAALCRAENTPLFIWHNDHATRVQRPDESRQRERELRERERERARDRQREREREKHTGVPNCASAMTVDAK